MDKNYKITGMHCESCVKKLTEVLLQVDGVKAADVTLDPPRAQVTGSKFGTHDIAEAVASAGDYSVSEATTDEPAAIAKQTSKLATYYPLILIVTFILAGCAILQFRTGTWDWMAYMADFMGGFFVVFGFFKLLDLRGFADAFQTYDIIASKSRSYGFIYPFIEVALGVAFLLRFEPLWTNVVTLIVMLVGSAGVLKSLLDKREIQCACLGTVFDLPMTTVTLVEDVGMAAMAAAMIALSVL